MNQKISMYNIDDAQYEAYINMNNIDRQHIIYDKLKKFLDPCQL